MPSLRIKVENFFRDILKKMSGRLGIDMQYAVVNSGKYLIGRIFNLATLFIASVLFARILPKAVFGDYRFIITMASTFSLFSLSGMGTAVARSVAQGKEGSLTDALKAEMRWGSLGSIFSLCFAAYYATTGRLAFGIAFTVLAFFLPLLNVFNIYNSVLQGKKKFTSIMGYGLISSSVYLVLLVITLLLTQKVYFLILPFLIIGSLLQVIFYYHMRAKLPLNDSEDPDMVRYGKHLSVMSVVGTVANNIDQFIVYQFLGPVQLAVYAMALAPTEQIKGTIKIIAPLISPKYASQSADYVKKSVREKTFKFFLLVALIVGVYILLAPYAFMLLFPQYMDAVPYTRGLALTLLATGSLVPVTALETQRQQTSLYKWSTIGALMQIVTVCLGAAFFGLWGIVGARIMTKIFEFGYAMLLSQRMTQQ